ncbi:MAG: autotransporter [Spirochaetaceae bacterium]|nr:autotransporter [Spirochaetaceae bacterium]
MKKALSVFLMTAMAFGAFAQDAEPVADVNIAEFSGNAAVQWGVDLDSGTTGFQNSYEVNLKLNLLNNGIKSTTGDGVWGELVLKTEEDTFIGWENGDDSPEVGDEYINDNTGLMGGGRNFGLKVYVDVAKIHIGPAYIGIKRGDTQTGELKMDAAIRSADDDQSKWLSDVGPAKYSEGIVLGLDTEVVKLDLDLRSKPTTKPAKRVVAYVLDKDGNLKAPGTTLAEDDVIHYFDGSTYTATKDDVGKSANTLEQSELGGATPNDYYYTDNYAAALEAELKGDGIGVEGLSVKAGASYNFAKNSFKGPVQHNEEKGTSTAKDPNGDIAFGNFWVNIPEIGEVLDMIKVTPEHTVGYSASVAYKLGLNDTFFIRPQIGFTGETGFYNDYEVSTQGVNVTGSYNKTKMAMAAGLLFGWGEIGMDQDAGVYYLDDDMAKKVSPGVGVVAYIPFATKTNLAYKATRGNITVLEGTEKLTNYEEFIRIMPSFYSGEIIPGLTAAAYADIAVTKLAADYKVSLGGKTSTTIDYKAKDAKVPMAFALGAQYAIPVGEMTITPKAGIRFANAAYVDYDIKEKDDGVFAGMGDQKKLAENAEAKTKYGLESDGNYMNVKVGVDVAGLVDNTTLSVIWATNNILNNTDYPDNTVGPKLGTLNFKAKIAL